MKLQISQLNEGETPLHFESSKEGWLKELMARIEKQTKEVRFEKSKPMLVDLRLTKLEPDYYLRGKMNFALGQVCARCAETFSQPIQQGFELALSHVSSGRHVEAKLEEESEELDINFFEGNEIDLAPVLEEQFYLSLPLKAVCDPNCKGICQHCGKNLNSGPCGCTKETNMSPFAVLKNLKP